MKTLCLALFSATLALAASAESDAPFSNAALYPTAPAKSIETMSDTFKALNNWRDTAIFEVVFDALTKREALPKLDPLPPALLIPTNKAFVNLLLTLAPAGADKTNVALVEAAVGRLAEALSDKDAPKPIIDAVAKVILYHVPAAGEPGLESAIKMAGTLKMASGGALDTSAFPKIKDVSGGVSTRLGRSVQSLKGSVVYLIDRVLVPFDLSALADVVFPAGAETPAKPADKPLPDYPAEYLPYENPGFPYGIGSTDPPAPYYYGLKNYVSFVANRADLNVFRALVLYDDTLRTALPTLKDNHLLVPTDAAFFKLVKALKDDGVSKLVKTLKKNPADRKVAFELFDKVVPMFDALDGVPSLREVVLYHVMEGSGDLGSRSGPQKTLYDSQTVSVMVEDDHDHGEHEGHEGHDDEHEGHEGHGDEREGHDGEEKHYFITDLDGSRKNSHVVVTFPTGQGYVSVLDDVLLPVNLGEVLESAPQPSMEAEENEEKDGVCFPADAQVMGADGFSTRMADLKAGDFVRNHHMHEAVSRVFLFSHRDSKAQVQFVRVETASGHVVRATANHYLYVDGKLRAFGAVKKGDMVHTVKGDSRVVKVSRVVGRGLYAPHSMKSDLVVDGVLVSSYSTAVHPRWAEAVLSPVRMVARLGITEPLGNVLYNGADHLVGYLPKGEKAY